MPDSTGVPEVSILGPTLFFLDLDDFINFLCDYHTVCYADDTTLLNVTNEKDNALVAEIMISKIYDWYCANGLPLNYDKTRCMYSRMEFVV